MPDYVSLQATAKTLVEDAGRTVTFVRFDRTPTDATKPWRGTETPANDDALSVTGKALSRIQAKAVMVDPASARNLGVYSDKENENTRAEKVFIVATTSVNADLSTYDAIEDNGVVWRICYTSELKPGDTSLLFYVWVKL